MQARGQHDNLVINLQVGTLTVTPRRYTDIELPNDKYSDYHFAGLPSLLELYPFFVDFLREFRLRHC
jgi:hypothetical protein